MPGSPSRTPPACGVCRSAPGEASACSPPGPRPRYWLAAWYSGGATRERSPDRLTAIERPPWLVRRLFPLLATIVMAAVGMAGTIWGPRYYGKTAWALPDDLWGTLIAAHRLGHLNLAGLYSSPTQLVSLPIGRRKPLQELVYS